MLEFAPRDAAGSTGKVCLCGIGSAGTKVMEEVLTLSPQATSVCAMNLDARLLNASSVPCKIHLGAKLTRGLGSGGDSTLGVQAAQESEASILRALDGCALTVIAAGLGGGTGSGVAPEVARLAKECGSYVVSVVIRPFHFEGERRSGNAEEALSRLSLYSDMVLRFDNDAMESLIDSDKGVLEAFSVVNSLIARAVLIVPSLLDNSGSLLRVGLDDLSRVVGTAKGICSFGVGEGRLDASLDSMMDQVKRSPLFMEKRLQQVDDLLVLVRGGRSLTLHHLEHLISAVAELLGGNIGLHIGASVDESAGDRVELTVLGVVPSEERTVQPLPLAACPEPVFVREAVVLPQPPVDIPAPAPEPELVVSPKPVFVPVRRSEHELEDELMALSPSHPVPPEEESLPEEQDRPSSLPAHEFSVSVEPSSDLRDLEEGTPPSEGEEGRAGMGLFARVRPLFLDGEDLDLPPALRKKKPDVN